MHCIIDVLTEFAKGPHLVALFRRIWCGWIIVTSRCKNHPSNDGDDGDGFWSIPSHGSRRIRAISRRVNSYHLASFGQMVILIWSIYWRWWNIPYSWVLSKTKKHLPTINPHKTGGQIPCSLFFHAYIRPHSLIAKSTKPLFAAIKSQFLMVQTMLIPMFHSEIAMFSIVFSGISHPFCHASPWTVSKAVAFALFCFVPILLLHCWRFWSMGWSRQPLGIP